MSFGLDAKKAADICQTEMYGDWYRDPWGWPELPWVMKNPQDFPWSEIVHRDGNITLRREPRFEPTVVPKSRLGVRPAVVMSLDVRIAYAAAIAQVTSKLHANLPEWVYGWRLRKEKRLANNGDEWKNYSSFFHNPSLMEGYALQTDITSFFASIDVNKAVDVVYSEAGDSAGARLIEKIVRSHHELASRNGLPQRSWPSAILANRYMAPLDNLISQRLSSGQLTGAVRWMDDIYVTGEEATLYKFFLDFQSRVRELGLEANASKSRLGRLKEIRHDVLLEGLQEVPIPVKKRIQILENGSDVVEAAVEEMDIEWLRKLEGAALERPFSQSSATIKVILKTLRKHKEYGNFDRWLEFAEKLSHVADALGRYFRDAIKEDSRKMGAYCDWYSGYRATEWAAIHWSSAQFALAIPSFTKLPAYREVMAEWLEKGSDLHQISVAAQRLSQIDPTATKDIIRRRLDDEARPIFQRVYSLALMNARDERLLISRTIKQDASNVVTREWLEANNYAAPKISADYDSVASE
ncbi:reverse transcriptase domain-containing protein [Streptomyces sp. NPDC018036]|uniref:reverse transcriptase domain-containing protein n=1 Tax=Streptomyces sp. NPDC018036 TaxID=3365035 RepID=UPI0037953856